MKLYLGVALVLLVGCSDKTSPTAPAAPRVQAAPTAAEAEPRAAAGNPVARTSKQDGTGPGQRARAKIELRNSKDEKPFGDLSVK